MDYHKNAPWTAVSRGRLARMVIDDGLRVSTAALQFSVSAKTAAKWVGRYRQSGAAGMADRSSRPHHSPRQTASPLLERVVVLRWGYRPGYRNVEKLLDYIGTESILPQSGVLKRDRSAAPSAPPGSPLRRSNSIHSPGWK